VSTHEKPWPKNVHRIKNLNFCISIYNFFPPTSDGHKIRQNTLYVMLINVNCSSRWDILFITVVFEKNIVSARHSLHTPNTHYSDLLFVPFVFVYFSLNIDQRTGCLGLSASSSVIRTNGNKQCQCFAGIEIMFIF